MTPSTPSTPVLTGPTIPSNNTAYRLLSRAHPSDKASTIFTDKIKNKPLLLQPSHTVSTNTEKRSLRRHIRLRKKQYFLQHQKPRPLSAKEKRQLGTHALEPNEIKYDIYRGLNRLWQGYILDVLGLVDAKTGRILSSSDKNCSINPGSHGSLLASADFHGMQVEIVRCVDVGRVGLTGIVVRETRSTFVLVTERDKAVTVLKKGAIFKVVVPLEFDDDDEERKEIEEQDDHGGKSDERRDQGVAGNPISPRKIVFELHGSQLEVRPIERAVKKFKWKNIDYL